MTSLKHFTSNMSFLHLLTLSLLLPTVLSATCTTPKLSSTTPYTTCTPLSSLSAALHYTYHPSNHTLSVAFTATPPSSAGWVAWGINPSGTGMLGGQAFVAYKSPSSSAVTVSTFNLSSYAAISAAPLSFPVYSHSGEFNAADGSFTIYAAVKSDGGKVNHIWQVGPGVTKGVPDKHAINAANLQSKATIDVTTGVAADSGASSSSAVDLGLKKRNVGYFFLCLSLFFVYFCS
ncbi:hypothetical protein RND81_05G228500 [Saponaria officinalis]|uniref:DOMON domain-containing protein n=1 Tax=Saponaria officinalis TaxID=3572 RepID=A0AAW1L2D7_SAPOF